MALVTRYNIQDLTPRGTGLYLMHDDVFGFTWTTDEEDATEYADREKAEEVAEREGGEVCEYQCFRPASPYLRREGVAA